MCLVFRFGLSVLCFSCWVHQRMMSLNHKDGWRLISLLFVIHILSYIHIWHRIVCEGLFLIMLWSSLWLPILVIALLLDWRLGEPRRWHPLVGFGWLAAELEQRFNRLPFAASSVVTGGIALILLLLPCLYLIWWLQDLPRWGEVAAVVILYLCLGGRSLADHAQTVSRALDEGSLDDGRNGVAMMVSRDTAELDEAGVCRATMESVLENGADAIFATLFWFIVAGPVGAVAHRLVNTLDAMWGYHNDRYRYFGRAAARLDDLLNYIPARLCAISYACVGQFSSALSCWRQQAAKHDSPNAGVVMAAGAGALQCQLGGAARYAGEWHARPPFGCGHPPASKDIGRVITLVNRAVVLWVVVAFFLWIALWSVSWLPGGVL